MADFQSGFGFLGGAVSDLFAAKGSRMQAASLDDAAKNADHAADLTKYAGVLKASRVSRDAYRVLGGQNADVAAAGFGASGSALDIMRSSAADAALAIGITKTQTNIDVNDFLSQAAMYRSEAAQARAAAQGSTFGSILKLVAGVGSLFL